jgi:hypothetical protein
MPAGFFTSCKVRTVPQRDITRRVLKTHVGTFAETSSPEDQLHWIFENCKVVRGANGLPNIIEAMKIASSKHDLLWSEFRKLCFPERVSYTLCSSLSEQDAIHFQISAQDRADILEEVTTELSVYLGMLYHVIEVFKGHDDFADELSKYPLRYSSLYLHTPLSSEFGPATARLPHQHCFGTS